MTRCPDTPISQRVLLALVLLAAPSAASLQTPKDSPEPVIRDFVKAIFANDVATFDRLSVPDPRRTRLTRGGKPNPDKLRQLEEDPDLLQIKQIRPPLFHGRPVAIDRVAAYPVSTTALYRAVSGGQPMVVTLVRQTDGWRVDLRWWLAMTDLELAPARPNSPEYAARGLILALIKLDRKGAARFAAANASMDQLFAYAPREHEPSGVMDALAAEMPIVELAAGEYAQLPDGRIVQGTGQDDVKVLVGQMGVVEVPFVAHRTGQTWRIEPQSYFALLLR